jgi:3-deoxy-D-manno-octulosonic-acid transferase
MYFLYECAIRLMVALFSLAALFVPKARLWVEGRRKWRIKMKDALEKKGNRRTLWLHAASLGEFEQGRPLIEAFREKYPDWFIVLTFFSPSGYEIRKNYPQADLVSYLPADTRRNATDFLEMVQPELAVFVKYEFWGNYLSQLKKRPTPTLLVSALFRSSQPFFKPWGGFWRQMLGCFTHLFVQRQDDARLLQTIGLHNYTVAGDTRVDRVLQMAMAAPANELVATFSQNSDRILIAGSTWPPDETILLEAISSETRVIIAPHDPSALQTERLLAAAKPGRAGLYSQGAVGEAQQILIIDNVGMLNTLYPYGQVAYIGGGFGKGIHNTLEPAAFGLPVIFGPKYQKFEEARQFIARGGAFSVQNSAELKAVLEQLKDPAFYQKASEAVRDYLEENRGATGRIMTLLADIIRPD